MKQTLLIEDKTPKDFIKTKLIPIKQKVLNLRLEYKDMSPSKLDDELRLLNAMFSEIEYKVSKGLSND